MSLNCLHLIFRSRDFIHGNYFLLSFCVIIMLSLLLLSSADEPVRVSEYPWTQMQRESMIYLLNLEDVDRCDTHMLNAMRLISRGDDESADDVCLWRGVQCVEDIIHSIGWTINDFIPMLLMKSIPSIVLFQTFVHVAILMRKACHALSLPCGSGNARCLG